MRYETVTAATIVAPWRSRSPCSAPRGSNGTASGWPSTRARRRRCWLIWRLPTAPGRARRSAACCGRPTTRIAPGVLCVARSRPCAAAVGEEWIDAAGDSIALRRGPGLELDVERFRKLAADGASLERLSEAVALFSGDFLEGFSLRDSPDFDDWQMGEADTLKRELGSALRRLVELLAARWRIRASRPARPPVARGRSPARARPP